MTGAGFSHRLATAADLPALGLLVEAAMARLMSGHLSPAEIESSRAIMGVDSQLVADGTYYVVESEGRLAGGGGWSRRVTMYGGDASPGRDARLLDPAREPMRVRAMFTAPDFARRGVGRLVLGLCEDAARAEGFRRAQLVATMPGLPLYEACGFRVTERFTDATGGAPVPLARMEKELQPPDPPRR